MKASNTDTDGAPESSSGHVNMRTVPALSTEMRKPPSHWLHGSALQRQVRPSQAWRFGCGLVSGELHHNSLTPLASEKESTASAGLEKQHCYLPNVPVRRPGLRKVAA